MKNLNHNLFSLLIVLFLFLPGANMTGQGELSAAVDSKVATDNTPEKPSVFAAWVKEGQIHLTIESDFTNLITSKNENKYQKAKLIIDNTSGKVTSADIKIKARGKYRRKNCDFPPLKINFDKDELKLTGLDAKFDKFKLVTHCTDSEEDEQNVLKEYLAYKMYNQLTPKSFQVKLVKVTYIDNAAEGLTFDRYAFVVESTKELAKRLGGKEIEQFNISLDTLKKIERQVFTMFQFMIGNTDWNTNMMHNVKFIRSEKNGELMIIPYDFDFAGMVNSTHARPNPDLRQTNVRERIYMDKVNHIQEIKKAINYFEAHEKAVYQIVQDFDGLNKKNKRDILQYLKSFYKLIGDSILSEEAFVKENL